MKNYDDYLTPFLKKKGSFLIKFAIVGVSIIVLLFILQICLRKFDKTKETFRADLNGVVLKKLVYRGDSWVKLTGYSKRYVLEFACNYKLDPFELNEFLQIGDSIHKPAQTDSLYIIRNDQKFLFILDNIQLNKE